MTPSPDHQAPDEAEGERATHLFFSLCTLLVIAFFVWSYFGRLDVVSSAMGEVIPSSQVKQIQHLEGGIVSAILVREGEVVKRGQAMVNLEPVATGADVEELNVRVTALNCSNGLAYSMGPGRARRRQSPVRPL